MVDHTDAHNGDDMAPEDYFPDGFSVGADAARDVLKRLEGNPVLTPRMDGYDDGDGESGPHPVFWSTIPDNVIPVLVDMATGFVAELIQNYIDAGSEREVTIEDEVLNGALTKAFDDWSHSSSQFYQGLSRQGDRNEDDAESYTRNPGYRDRIIQGLAWEAENKRRNGEMTDEVDVALVAITHPADFDFMVKTKEKDNG
jgi:hypothetical protein